MTGLVQFPASTLASGLVPTQVLVPNLTLLPASAGLPQFDKEILTASAFPKGTLP